ncbi:MAG TPA: SigE family RNA polymerase sigma factor, partial [Mycobacteriales bacterium]|nr:SigE family RNA polymerase sigma factor [Mycobacteriales bacterium]
MQRDQYETFEDFVAGAATRLLRAAVFLVADRHQAEDLVQIAFERTARHWRRVVRSGNPEAYARRVLVNLAIDDTRRRRRKPALPGGGAHELDQLGSAAPDRRIADLELRDLVERSLAALPPRQRAVLVLRYWCDLTEREIAADLGISVGTVKSQAARAL